MKHMKIRSIMMLYDGIELWLQENADGRLLASVGKYKGAPGYARLAETIRMGMKG